MEINKALLTRIFQGALLVCIAFLLFKNVKLQDQINNQQMLMVRQAELLDSVKNAGLAPLMANILSKIDADLKDNSKRTLRDETIAGIVALSYLCKPYAQSRDHSLSGKILSPERGQLLIMISSMHIDSGSLSDIMHQASFAEADLRDADLTGAYLSGTDLHGADLYGACLQGAKLDSTNLGSATLWGANLSQSGLKWAIFKTADLSWADLSGADLRGADLNGADMTSAQLRKANLQGADLHYANFSGAFLLEATLDSTNMNSANLKRARLGNASLIDANLTSAHLNEADLTGADMTGVQISLANMSGANLENTELTGVTFSDMHWLTQLDEWNVTGASNIQRKYKIVDIPSDQKSRYRLEKSGN